MLTASQCRVVAYNVRDGIVCNDCVEDTEDCTANEIIEYSAEEMAGDDGLTCDRCGKEIVEATPRCEDCGELTDDCTCDDSDSDDDDSEEDTDDDDDDTEDSAPVCPACGGPGVPLGVLGKLAHYRCRNCGIDFSRENS